MKNKAYKKPLIILLALFAIGAGVGVSAYVSAQTGNPGARGHHMMMDRPHGMMDGATKGTVSSINGNSVTFTVSDSSKIKVGDTVIVLPPRPATTTPQ